MVTGVEAINPRTSSNRNSSSAEKCSAGCGGAYQRRQGSRSTSSHDKVSAVSGRFKAQRSAGVGITAFDY